MKVLDRGEVSLINFMGGDDAVVAAARVSNGVLYENASKGSEKDYKLISFLMKHRHGTPFEHSVFTFYIKAPIFVAREWFRHRISSYNEVSGRYIEFEPEFYIPETYRVPGDTNKQGSKFFEGDVEEVNWFNYNAHEHVLEATMTSYKAYRSLLDSGVAKEMARMILPLNLYTQYYWTVNARALMNFVSLRNAPDAQLEIQEYARNIESIFGQKMPQTWEAFLSNGRIAP